MSPHMPGALLLLLFCLVAVPGQAEDGARTLLDRMSHSFRELDYRGIFTYEYGSSIDAMRIIHVVQDGVERERMVYLNGDPREIVREGHQLSCIHPGHQIMRLDSELSARPFVRSFSGHQDLADYYTLSLGGEVRIADRTAVEIVVRPLDQYRYGFHLFLDKDTALMLKSLTVSPSGRVLERFQFVEIEIGADVGEVDLGPPLAASKHPHHYVIEPAADGAGGVPGASPVPRWLPPGFTLSARTGAEEAGSAARMAMYTDGFSTLTLVLEVAASAQPVQVEGKARRGATVAYMRPLIADGRSYVLTVVGEVPLVTAIKVAHSVDLTGEKT